MSESKPIKKSDTLWPIQCQLTVEAITTGIWTTKQWQLSGFNLAPTSNSHDTIQLELYRDERTDYRFNLSSVAPKLFLILEDRDPDDGLYIVTLTASQSVASSYMDSDYLVLSHDMPLVIQAWIEAFIGRNGELIEQRRKNRKETGGSL